MPRQIDVPLTCVTVRSWFTVHSHAAPTASRR